jgi:hypothetical protein
VSAYYETINNLLSFPTHFPSKSLGLNLRATQKRPVSVGGYTLLIGLISVKCVRLEREPKVTHSRPKRDLFATSVQCTLASLLVVVASSTYQPATGRPLYYHHHQLLVRANFPAIIMKKNRSGGSAEHIAVTLATHDA